MVANLANAGAGDVIKNNVGPGPGVARGRSQTAELRDVAPTILHLLGMPAPARMSGRVLSEILSGVAPAPAGQSIDAPAALQLAGITDADQVCVEARLRDLGYLD